MESPRIRWLPGADKVRARVPDINDGVLAVAGLAEGLSVAGQSRSLATIISVAAFAGALSTAGTKFAEESAEREVQLDLIRAERRLLSLEPEEELAELTEHFVAKGVSEGTARQVAEELHAADALTAQLETEYGITELISARRPFTEAFSSGMSFFLGATVPAVLAIVVPRPWVEEYIVVGVFISLTITAIVLSRLGQTHVIATIARSLLIGIATMLTAVIAATIVSEI
ncbi:VIT1/CCC1 transporter family protein [Kribbia dieselivorans]|uniref:VIT1/CCC1 transporter family protein n=1 Tax=Kribbia dieselivorans TaxID=331526 RepID=UPI00147019D7|nr:VIT1/CCC1 transporter family protein [Kribbia dieselivorans]